MLTVTTTFYLFLKDIYYFGLAGAQLKQVI